MTPRKPKRKAGTRRHDDGHRDRREHDIRLAEIEAHLGNQDGWLVRLDEHVKKVEYTVHDNQKQTSLYRELILEKLGQIQTELARYKGMIGGVILMASAIGAAFVYFKSWLLTKLGIPS